MTSGSCMGTDKCSRYLRCSSSNSVVVMKYTVSGLRDWSDCILGVGWDKTNTTCLSPKGFGEVVTKVEGSDYGSPTSEETSRWGKRARFPVAAHFTSEGHTETNY